MASRLGTVRNLEPDGTYDTLLFEFPKGYPNGVINLAFSNTPRKATGVQKVAQSFVKCLFTTKGSDPIRENYGTNFTADNVGSNIQKDANAVTRNTVSAIKDAEKQIKILLGTSNRDKASQLDSADLITIDAEQDRLTVHIRIITRAGEAAAVAIPFPQSNLELN